MKLSVLTNNLAGAKCRGEFGLSFLLETEHSLILLDAGQTGLFLENAEIMGIDLSDLDAIALSHGHFDHGNGLTNLSGFPLICHPGCFVDRHTSYPDGSPRPIGLSFTQAEAEERFKLKMTKDPYWIDDKTCFLGEIPRIHAFEDTRTTFYLDTPEQYDPVIDDTALAINTEQGIIVVSGCSHSGICNIVSYAQKVMNNEKVYGVIGGFHLKKANAQTKETISFLRQLNIQHLIPCHCTELPAMALFWQEFRIRELRCGDIIDFDLG